MMCRPISNAESIEKLAIGNLALRRLRAGSAPAPARGSRSRKPPGELRFGRHAWRQTGQHLGRLIGVGNRDHVGQPLSVGVKSNPSPCTSPKAGQRTANTSIARAARDQCRPGCRGDQFRRIEGDSRIADAEDMRKPFAIGLDRSVVVIGRGQCRDARTWLAAPRIRLACSQKAVDAHRRAARRCRRSSVSGSVPGSGDCVSAGAVGLSAPMATLWASDRRHRKAVAIRQQWVGRIVGLHANRLNLKSQISDA